MKSFSKRIVVAAALITLLSANVFGQVGEQKGPASKIYLAETKGGGKIENDGKVYEPKQGSSFSALGTAMSTGSEAHQSYVLSTGGGLYLTANTEVKVVQFEQERFPPGHRATDAEPSVSHVGIEISRGMVAVCASQMVSGTTMVFSTPLASVNIRGHQVAIQVAPGETTISVLEGSVTVRIGDKDPGGVTLQAGERVVVHPGPPGQPSVATVAPIDDAARGELEAEIGLACSARKTVSFETTDSGGEIVAKPTVTVLPPNNLTVSPDRINPGT